MSDNVMPLEILLLMLVVGGVVTTGEITNLNYGKWLGEEGHHYFREEFVWR